MILFKECEVYTPEGIHACPLFLLRLHRRRLFAHASQGRHSIIPVVSAAN
jgi:hypothetical protein